MSIEAKFEDMKGMVIVDAEGLKEGSDEVVFFTLDDKKFRMDHQQDCCESVYVADVVGDITDILGYPILVAEEVTSEDPNAAVGYTHEYPPESCTWTFYKLRTFKGRWLSVGWVVVTGTTPSLSIFAG